MLQGDPPWTQVEHEGTLLWACKAPGLASTAPEWASMAPEWDSKAQGESPELQGEPPRLQDRPPQRFHYKPAQVQDEPPYGPRVSMKGSRWACKAPGGSSTAPMSLDGPRVSLYIGTEILGKSHNFSNAEFIYLYGIDTHPCKSEISINFAKLLLLSYSIRHK